MNFRKITSVMLALVMLLAITGVAFADTTTKVDVVVPLDLWQYVSCANGGAGEYIHLNGQLHILLVTVMRDNGSMMVQSHYNPQYLSGVGLVTGDKYQGTGVTRDIFVLNYPQTSYTFINNFRMIGQGPDNNFMIHTTFHYTVNALGEMVVNFDNTSTTCK